MQQYNIIQCIEPNFSEDLDQAKEFAGIVEAESLEDAYIKSQNITEQGWNPEEESRSTSVGDMIQDTVTGEVFLVKGFGFKLLGIEKKVK